MKAERAEIEKMEKLAAEIERNPLTKKFREEEAAVTLFKRLAAADRIEALRHEAENYGVIQAEVDIMVERLADIERQRQELKTEIGKKRATLMRTRLDIESEINTQEKILYETSDPSIDEAIKFFQDRREILFRKKPDSQTRRTGSNIFAMVKNFVIFSNSNAIEKSLAYCLVCMKKLECMKLIPTLDVNRIDELKRGVPDADEMIETTGEKPFPRINVDPGILLPSNSEMDWKLGKLNKKFQKLMKRI